MGTLYTDRLATRPLLVRIKFHIFSTYYAITLKPSHESRCPKHISTNTNTTTMRETRTRPCSAVTVASNVAKRRQLKIQTITILRVIREKSLPNCRMLKKITRSKLVQSRLNPNDDCHNQLITRLQCTIGDE